MQKRRTRTNPKASPPLMTIVWTRILGTTMGALRTSSLMWMAPSNPGGVELSDWIPSLDDFDGTHLGSNMSLSISRCTRTAHHFCTLPRSGAQ